MGRQVVWMALLVTIGTAALPGCARRGPAPAPPGPAAPAANLDELTSALQQAAEGAGVSGPLSLKTYGPADMYEAIDGEADLFLSYDCRGLAVARYEAGQATVDAEIFDQGEPLNAFGVFSQLRPSGARSLAIGAGGARVRDEGIFFWKSQYFVRVAATGAQRPASEVLDSLSQGLADKLQGSSRLPQWTEALPVPEGDDQDVQYVARNVLGHAFLSHAVIAEHLVGEATCRLVLVRADDQPQAQTWWLQLEEFYHGSAADPGLQRLGSEAFVGRDLQNQPVRAVRSGRYLVLAIGHCGADHARQLVRATLGRLKDVK